MLRALALLSVLTLGLAATARAQAPREIPYQGTLADGGAPVTAATPVVFRLHDAATGGTVVWAESQTVTPDADGRFTARLGSVADLPASFDQPLWLSVTASGTALGPRTPLGAAPVALALYGLRVVPPTTAGYGPSIVAGHPLNTAGVGAVVAGGGFDDGTTVLPNRATGSLSTVSGGQNNTSSSNASTVSGGQNNTASFIYASVGGGQNNTSRGIASTVSGGNGNTASFSYASVGGGQFNTSSSIASTVSGGSNNTASFSYASVGGGQGNTASGIASTVPGGRFNRATGDDAFAAGRSALAVHDHAFVWSGTSSLFSSTAAEQFLVDAPGGVGIGTDAPTAQLHVRTDGSGARPQLVLDEISATDFARLDFRNANPSGYTWTVAGGGTDAGSLNLFTRGRNVVEFKADAADGGTSPNLITTSAGGAALTQGGVWTNASSRALKTEFLPVDGAAVLDALADVEVTTWRYHAEADGVRHLGPMSQDFYAAFGLGASDETIGTADADGVALAAVKALYELSQRQADHIDRQAAELDALRAEVQAIRDALAPRTARR